VGETVRLDRGKTLVEQERLDEPRSGRIALNDGFDVGAHRLADGRLRVHLVEEYAAERLGGQEGIAQKRGKPMYEGLLECRRVEDLQVE
jgi:hypothetical protein